MQDVACVALRATNEAQALAFEALLRESGISCVVVPLADTAYPGVTDRGRPWGEVRVAEADLSRAQELVQGLRPTVGQDLIGEQWKAGPEPIASTPRRGPRAFLWLALVLLAAWVLYGVPDLLP